MKTTKIRALLFLLAAASLCGCQAPGQPKPQAEPSKAVVKLQRKAWSLGFFLADLAGNIIVNTATNYANQKLGGFAK